MKNNSEAPSGIVLLAKQSGRTSFSSLTVIKKALGTSKVGHTGTLDSFADGLLVVLSNRLTRLVPAITDFDKEYTALIEFGSETDTLDPTGNVIKTAPVPAKEDVLKALPFFTGPIMQKPPVFSALHVNGQRASDMARKGLEVDIPARPVTIHELELLDFKDKYALIRVRCSKGTYIRCLGRDIAEKCGSCAHLKALRRTRVGPFKLEEAAGFHKLGAFNIEELLKNPAVTEELKSDAEDFEKERAEVRTGIKKMDKVLAQFCGFDTVQLKDEYIEHFYNGRPPVFKIFDFQKRIENDCKIAVFTSYGDFAGIIECVKGRLSYVFVIPRDKKVPVKSEDSFKIYTWDDVVEGRFDEETRKKGTALTIGSFDGPHLGHDTLFEHCRRDKNLVPGIVTFRAGLRSFKSSSYAGDVSTLNQKLRAFEEQKMAFALVIDFSESFGKIEGTEFLSILIEKCGMKYLVEGEDFRCGYKGATDDEQIKAFAEQKGFTFFVHKGITYKDRKVSSSRIREDVQNALFEDAAVMLNRPYEIDCCGFKWERIVDNNENYIKSLTRGIQVLPKDGDYPVTVISGSEVISGQISTTCKLVSGELRLLDSDGSLYENVRAIQFSLPEK